LGRSDRDCVVGGQRRRSMEDGRQKNLLEVVGVRRRERRDDLKRGLQISNRMERNVSTIRFTSSDGGRLLCNGDRCRGVFLIRPKVECSKASQIPSARIFEKTAQ
jgi:hypothetical protein